MLLGLSEKKNCKSLQSSFNITICLEHLTFIFIFVMCFMSTPVFAAPMDCGVIADITGPAAKLIMIAAPIILVVMGAVDILTVVSSGDDRGMKKAWSNLIKRFVICVVILLLPLLVNFIIGWTTFNDLTACL